jgi:NAD(P)-dependent dehydrogenase (short-subunit alcohol dehydrogenase family)
MLSELRGRVAVVTGAGSGIGRSLVLRLAAEGMSVVAADVEAGAVEETVTLVPAASGEAGGPAVLASVTDVADAGAVDALADLAYERFGAVHLLANNAGVFRGGVLWERTDAEIEWVLGVNLYGILNGIRSFVPRMLAGGEPGHIVNTASMAGLVSLPLSGPYVVSKFAAVGASEALGHDLASVGADIGVSVLCPSLVATGIGTSTRNAPPGVVDGERTPDVELVETALLEGTTADGMPPDEVAGLVVDAVRRGDFYIGTKPSFDPQVADRTEAVLARRLPAMPAID